MKNQYKPILLSDKTESWGTSILQQPKAQDNSLSTGRGGSKKHQVSQQPQEKRQLSVYTGSVKPDSNTKNLALSNPNNPALSSNLKIPASNVQRNLHNDIQLQTQESDLLSADSSIKKVPFTTRDAASGRMIICLLEPSQTILDLKHRIAQQEGFQTAQMRLKMGKRELSDDEMLTDFVNDMDERCFELYLKPVEVQSGSLNELRGSSLRLR